MLNPDVTTTVFDKPVIVVEGIIGAGKTTLTRILEKELNLKGYFEPVDSNPYLKLFYAEEARIKAGGDPPNKYAFPMQMELMHRRFAMHKSACWEVTLENEYSGAIIDRSIFGDRVFAKLLTRYGSIEEIMWRTYERAFNIMSYNFNPPHYMVFLDTPVEIAWKRARGDTGRNRDQETPLENDDFYNYLIDLKEEHYQLLREIEAGMHRWSNYVDIIKIPWTNGLERHDIQPVIDTIKARTGLTS